jgi:hypothetical protein
MWGKHLVLDCRGGDLAVIPLVVSGIGDAQGFVYSGQVWDGGHIVPAAAGKSPLGFALGTLAYWLAIRYLREVGAVSTALQTMIWFGVRIAGVALVSGDFFRWSALNQALAASVLAGITWLLVQAPA